MMIAEIHHLMPLKKIIHWFKEKNFIKVSNGKCKQADSWCHHDVISDCLKHTQREESVIDQYKYISISCLCSINNSCRDSFVYMCQSTSTMSYIVMYFNLRMINYREIKMWTVSYWCEHVRETILFYIYLQPSYFIHWSLLNLSVWVTSCWQRAEALSGSDWRETDNILILFGLVLVLVLCWWDDVVHWALTTRGLTLITTHWQTSCGSDPVQSGSILYHLFTTRQRIDQWAPWG